MNVPTIHSNQDYEAGGSADYTWQRPLLFTAPETNEKKRFKRGFRIPRMLFLHRWHLGRWHLGRYKGKEEVTHMNRRGQGSPETGNSGREGQRWKRTQGVWGPQRWQCNWKERSKGEKELFWDKSRLLYQSFHPSIYQDKPLADETIQFKNNPTRP